MLTSDITLTKGDSRTVVIPVEDTDTSDEWADPSQADEIVYRIVPRLGSTSTLLELTDADAEVRVVEAQSVFTWGGTERPQELVELGVPEDQNVVRVRLSETQTDDLDDSRVFHECELRGFRDEDMHVMQGEVTIEWTSG